MMTIVQPDEDAQGRENAVTLALDDLAREGARRIILAALAVEVEEYLARDRSHMTENTTMQIATIIRCTCARYPNLSIFINKQWGT
jgi:hypothetical protein